MPISASAIVIARRVPICAARYPATGAKSPMQSTGIVPSSPTTACERPERVLDLRDQRPDADDLRAQRERREEERGERGGVCRAALRRSSSAVDAAPREPGEDLDVLARLAARDGRVPGADRVEDRHVHARPPRSGSTYVPYSEIVIRPSTPSDFQHCSSTALPAASTISRWKAMSCCDEARSCRRGCAASRIASNSTSSAETSPVEVLGGEPGRELLERRPDGVDLDQLGLAEDRGRASRGTAPTRRAAAARGRAAPPARAPGSCPSSCAIRVSTSRSPGFSSPLTIRWSRMSFTCSRRTVREMVLTVSGDHRVRQRPDPVDLDRDRRRPAAAAAAGRGRRRPRRACRSGSGRPPRGSTSARRS